MIRKAEIQDLEKIVSAEKAIFPKDPWSSKEYAYEIENNPFSAVYLLENENRVIGLLDLWITFEQAQISNIGILPQFRKQGMARRLMDFVIQTAKQNSCENISLEVRVSNTPAIALYESYGFIRVSTRRHYYEDGEDAWLMVKPMGGL